MKLEKLAGWVALSVSFALGCGEAPKAQPPAPTPFAASGGKLASLVFGVVGDTRPQQPDDSANYPTQDITWIYQNLEAASPRPAFVVATGDYAYCSGSDCALQTANYLTAAKGFSGQVFLAMGNHECNGYTSSNCASDNYIDVNGSTPNYQNFFSMLNTFGINATSQPTLASGNPYYEVDVGSADSTDPWTAKFVFIAANAWDSAQASWLTSVMAKQTTYTFVVRHESYQDDGGSQRSQPGDKGESDQIIDSSNAYTLLLVGHTHEYRQDSSGSGKVELIVGNGGAQSWGSPGYVICARVSGGNISCQPYNAGTSPSVNGPAVVVTPTGQPAS
ncbi:MAG: metallophosphoesterase family protein [Myxococcales bacterium]